MLEVKGTEIDRASLGHDLIILGLWSLWIIFLAGISLPAWLKLSAVSFPLVYGAWTWGFIRASLYFLILSWFYASVSLMPSGLLWMSLFLVFTFLRMIQFKILIRRPMQFAVLIFFTAFLLSATQIYMLEGLYPGRITSFRVVGFAFFSACIEALIGLFLFQPLQRWMPLR